MNEFDLKDLVAKIAQEVMNRIEYEAMEDENVEGTVAIFTTFVPSKKACAEALKEHFGVGIDAALLEGVAVRCGKGHDLEVHIDTDEANAAMIKNGDLLEIVK